jgi:hypothetical protein
MNGKRRLLGSFNHGAMANALPQAIGAQITYSGRQVISISGDGRHRRLLWNKQKVSACSWRKQFSADEVTRSSIWRE